MDFLRYFRLQKVTPKNSRGLGPRPRWIYRCLASRKIAHFQSRISSKWLSARSWHSFCPSKPVVSTDPQAHGSQNPLLYRELDCTHFVIRPPDAILDRFTDLHPSRKPDFLGMLPENMQNKAKEIPSLVLGTKMEKVFCRVSYGPSTLAMHTVLTACFGHTPVYRYFNFSNGSTWALVTTN